MVDSIEEALPILSPNNSLSQSVDDAYHRMHKYKEDAKYYRKLYENLQDRYDTLLRENDELLVLLSQKQNERDFLQISTELTPLRPTRSTRNADNSQSLK